MMGRNRRIALVFICACLLCAAATASAATTENEYVLADRSASAMLPRTWHAVGGQGCIIARGPEGISIMGMWGKCTEASGWDAGEGASGRGPYQLPGDFAASGLARALSAEAGLPVSAVKVVRIVPATGFSYPAVIADCDFKVGSNVWRGVLLLATWQVYGTERWGFYVSGVAAPFGGFDSAFYTLWRVFASFRPVPAYKVCDDFYPVALELKRIGGPRG